MMRYCNIAFTAALMAPGSACFLFDKYWEIDSNETGYDGTTDDKTFFMAEVTTYSSAEDVKCRQADVNKITEDFKQTLVLDGWTGTRKGGYDTRPSDFYD